ncbi:MAG: FecR domain-containing protein, partial [Pseudomonas sp.]
PSLSPKMCEEAMAWWLDMQEATFDSPTQAAFMAWRSEHPLHELAWEKALALGAQLDSLRTRGDRNLARQALLLPAQEGLSRRRAIKGLALLLTASAGAWSSRDSEMVSRISADYTTGVGEQRRVALAPDLSFELNTRSAINAHVTDHRWRLRLLSGEVLIDTAVNPAVLIDTAQIRAQTTSARFTVRQFDNGSTSWRSIVARFK